MTYNNSDLNVEIQEAYEESLEELSSVLKDHRDTSSRIEDLVANDACSTTLLKCLNSIVKELSDNQSVYSQVSSKGHQLIIEFCEANDLQWRKIKLTPGWQNRDSGTILGFTSDQIDPCLFKWRHNQSPPCYEAESPLLSKNILINSRNKDQFIEYGYLFYTTLRNHDRVYLKQLWQIIKSSLLGNLFVLIAISFGISLIGLAPSFLLSQIIGSAIPDASISLLLQYAAVLISALLTGNLLNLVRNESVLRVQSIIALRLGPALWDRILRLPVAHLNQFTSSELIERTQAISEVQSVLSGQTLIAIIDGLLSIVNIGLMIYYSKDLTLIALIVTILLGVITITAIRATIKLQIKRFQYESKVTGLTQGILSSIESLRTTASEAFLIREWAKVFGAEQKVDYKIDTINERSSIISEGTGQSLSIIILLFTAYVLFSPDETRQTLSLANLLGFNSAMGVFLGAALSLIGTIVVVQQQVTFLWNRLSSVLSHDVETGSKFQVIAEPVKSIQVRDVKFTYPNSNREILKGVNFNIKPGEHVALVGTSGSGKSTLIRLLLGFESIQSGFISYDHQDVKKISLPSLRKFIGAVLQDIELLSGTIGDNIKAGKNISEDEIWAALSDAAIGDKIKELPLKLSTPVTSGGANMSGGERQRIMLARAFAQKPSILIMDEATSALDNISQSIVEKAIATMSCTRITIAHRLNTIKTADRILMMDQGKVVESGSYHELIGIQGAFWSLVKSQLDAEASIQKTKRSNSF